MGVFWIFIGALALGTPHIASVGTDGMMAWGGLPYPGECAALLLLLVYLACVGVPQKLRKLLGPATLACTFVMLVLELVCAIFGEGSLGGFIWSAIDEALHVASATLWFALAACDMQAVQKQSAPDITIQALVVALLSISGAVWYLTAAAIRYALPAWEPNQEMSLWACAFLWVAPLATLYRSAPCSRAQFAVRAVAPVAGILLANRAWTLALSAGIAAPAVSSIYGVLLAAPVLSLAALVIAWFNEERAEQDASPVEISASTAGNAARLPLHLIPGYQTLSEREQAVLLQTLDGASSADIAAELGISENTVRTYRARAYEKMNVSGRHELLAAVRVSIEQPFPMPELPEPDLSPAVLTIPERVLPKLACVLVSLLAVFVLLMLRKVPNLVLRELIPCVLLAFIALFGAVKLRNAADACSREAAIMSTAIGTGVAMTMAALLFGPEAYLVRRTILSIVALIALVWLAYRAWPLWRDSPYLALIAFGLVGAACIPQGVRAQAFVHSTTPFFWVVACIVAAVFSFRRLLNDAEVLVAAATLAGDERTLSYLQGRGITDVMAQVTLLTARDYHLASIAATVHVSSTTVSKYRGRVYKMLEVSNKEELACLLEREAGFAVVVDKSAKEGASDE